MNGFALNDRPTPPTPASNSTRCARLRAMIESPDLEFLMEAHNGLSAAIVQSAGFKGIWGSGLAISAQFGVRDSNEASWTQVVDMLEFMSDAVEIPILLDGDTGYGNFNNMRRLVRKLEQRRVAGVCIEDKVFPKTNSFINGSHQPLADIDEFCGKIKAGKDVQDDPDFCIVARIEALIANWGMSEAMRRAEAYHRAGADAVLIHSRQSRPDEVLEFAREWGGRLPIVIVPTKYFSTPTQVFREAGISTVIWANHLLRAATAAMQEVAREIHDSQSLVEIEDRIAPVAEVFRLQGADELERAERVYLQHDRTIAVVLAATRGSGLDGVTEDRPKVMVPIAGTPLLERLTHEFKRQNINDIRVVAGYQSDAVASTGVTVIRNEQYEDTGEVASLACACDAFTGDVVVTYGDLLFRSYILRELLDTSADLVAVVDSSQTPGLDGTMPDAACCSASDDRRLFPQDVDLLSIEDRRTPGGPLPNGRWIGMLLVREEASPCVVEALDELSGREDFGKLNMPDLMNHLIQSGHAIKVHYIQGHWLDVNNHDDLDRAHSFAHGKAL